MNKFLILIKILIAMYILKIIYDFLNWIYGYLLHLKWIEYFEKDKEINIGYSYQIRKYLLQSHSSYYTSEIFSSYNKDKIQLCFLESHGYYKYLFQRNFNPINIFHFFFSLPGILMSLIGIKIRKKSTNLINIISWISGIIVYIYEDEITTFCKQIIKIIIENITKWFYFLNFILIKYVKLFVII